MKHFSTADLARKVGDVTHAASQAPVVITQHRKPRFVLMRIETFEAGNSRRAIIARETPDDIAEWLLPGLDRLARGEGYDD